MWILKMLLFSLVAGTFLGIGLRVFDELMEKYKK